MHQRKEVKIPATDRALGPLANRPGVGIRRHADEFVLNVIWCPLDQSADECVDTARYDPKGVGRVEGANPNFVLPHVCN